MVFYFKDLNLSNSIEDPLVMILIGIILLLPVLIYCRKYNYALYISLFLAGIQLIAIWNNVNKYPL